jgi:hypothetical protein
MYTDHNKLAKSKALNQNIYTVQEQEHGTNTKKTTIKTKQT